MLLGATSRPVISKRFVFIRQHQLTPIASLLYVLYTANDASIRYWLYTMTTSRALVLLFNPLLSKDMRHGTWLTPLSDTPITSLHAQSAWRNVQETGPLGLDVNTVRVQGFTSRTSTPHAAGKKASILRVRLVETETRLAEGKNIIVPTFEGGLSNLPLEKK